MNFGGGGGGNPPWARQSGMLIYSVSDNSNANGMRGLRWSSLLLF